VRRAHPTEKPTFSKLKKKFGGENPKNAKAGFFWRGAFWLCQNGRRGLCPSDIALKIGSDLRIVVHHKAIFREIVALSGDFFFGRAQREPNVFLGGNGKLPRLRRGLLFFGRQSRQLRFMLLLKWTQLN